MPLTCWKAICNARLAAAVAGGIILARSSQPVGLIAPEFNIGAIVEFTAPVVSYINNGQLGVGNVRLLKLVGNNFTGFNKSAMVSIPGVVQSNMSNTSCKQLVVEASSPTLDRAL